MSEEYKDLLYLYEQLLNEYYKQKIKIQKIEDYVEYVVYDKFLKNELLKIIKGSDKE